MAYDPRQHGQHAGHGPSFPAPGSHMNRFAASTASFATEMSANSYATHGPNLSREPYPAWTPDRGVPLSKEEIEDIFLDLTQKFGFQRDSMRNQFDYLMNLLDSRASRMSAEQALTTVHADYIGGQHANYRKWYFAAQLDLDDAVGKTQNPGLQRLKSVGGKGHQRTKSVAEKSLDSAGHRWRQAMSGMSHYDRLRQIALWLLCWGEGGNVRFTPECMCFIFKCADDYYRSPEFHQAYLPFPARPGLRDPEGKFVRREKDHEEIIGYDDVNQLFWYPEGIASIMMRDKSRLVDIPPAKRFMKFEQVDWKNSFVKTYFEKRTIFQLLVHFNRVWIIHLSFFWYYTAYNSPSIYNQSTGAPPTAAMRLVRHRARWSHIHTHHDPRHPLRIYLFAPELEKCLPPYDATILLVYCPRTYCWPDRVYHLFHFIDNPFFDPAYHRHCSILPSPSPLPCSLVSFLPGDFLVIALVQSPESTWPPRPLRLPTPHFPKASARLRSCSGHGRHASSKVRERYLGNALCSHQASFTLAIMFVMDLLLFFLDTYLWYVIWTSVISVARAFALGSSIWTLGRKLHRMPKRIFAKLLATGPRFPNLERDHHLHVPRAFASIDHVQQLMYHQAEDKDGRKTLRAPLFFTAQGTREFLPPGSEAERRISFFAQSLTASFPEPISVECMPTFTVLVPHYSEKILLSLREIIREEDQNTRVTLLEYLKQLHPLEWDNFVRDTKILAEEVDVPTPDEKSGKPGKADDLPFYCIGFKSSSPEFTLRTRIWASLRAQTLYRTISGFMNYAKAIKLLYRVENPEMVQAFQGDTERLEKELERMARRKFKYCVSMQRYAKFNKIAYLDEEPGKEGSEPRVFSALIDGHSEINPETKKRTPKFRIELPGTDYRTCKSSTPTRTILEECIKIRNLLGEFEEYNMSSQSPYGQGGHKEFARTPSRFSVRASTFSRRTLVFWDIAAGKEQTFGTLSARALAFIGQTALWSPRFPPRPDIFAGMTAFARGGRIKHSEYYQCGKGRDQGFGTVLNFQTKLGNGMGEQLLSRDALPRNDEQAAHGVQVQLARSDVGWPDWMLQPRPCVRLDQTLHYSIFSAFFIAFLPLFLQELMDRGAGHAMMRLGRHFLSLSPIFEVFSTQIYSQALLSNLTFGGARYIATGRGFATTRTSFSILYSRFAGPSIYLGMRSLLMLLYATMSIWIPHLIYFWFSFSDFIIDYREFLRWMSRGNSRSHSNSWIGYCRLSRTQITGYKKKKLGHPSEKLSSDVPRAGWRTVLLGEIIFPSAMATMLTIAYMFVKSFPDENGNAPASPLIRIAVISLGPVVWNSVVLLVLFFISLFMGPIMKNSCPKFGATIAFIAHMLSVIGMIGFFEFLWFLELWDASHAVLGSLRSLRFSAHVVDGTWYGRGLGTHAMSQPAREFVVKTVELSLWSGDFVLCHFLLLILLPFTLIPFVDTLHSTMLFWYVRPSRFELLYSTKQKRQRRKVVIKYGLVYFLSVAIFVGLIAGPALFREYIHFNCTFCTAI
ncbi:1,3-beta-glucan synthase subunit FKS1 [Rhizoctonia solani]|uniref:1,3-beta-glucan synthase n=1 Tax=Rhizoctonia solani TaxID=456999 RepID=A0A8H7LXT3_9AGAM|nr:1,3-beta-glucan synthase subunit FKS1 [Rhizoctonia solani]